MFVKKQEISWSLLDQDTLKNIKQVVCMITGCDRMQLLCPASFDMFIASIRSFTSLVKLNYKSLTEVPEHSRYALV